MHLIFIDIERKNGVLYYVDHALQLAQALPFDFDTAFCVDMHGKDDENCVNLSI